MATSVRDLRRKIKSIRGTQKITAAMQLVAASKMGRATGRAVQGRPYTEAGRAIVQQLVGAVETGTQPLLASRPGRTALVLLVASNRGLAGALNAALIRRFLAWQTAEAAGQTIKVVAVGAKGRQWLLRTARETLLADFPAPETVPDFADARPIAQLLLDEFLAGRTDRVFLAYNQFVSTLRQEPVIRQFLPIIPEDRGRPPAGEAGRTEDRTAPREVVFEPSQTEVLAALLPRLISAELYQVLLESHASEQAARMLAMKNATDNAADLIDDLTLTANSFRQAGITGELLDIAAGASALEG